MTERFEIFPQNVAKDGTLIIIQKGLKLYNINDVVELLNTLNEENEQLKEEIQECRDYNAKIYSDVAQNEIILSRENKQLTNENEQLKYQNEMLSDELEQAKAVINKKWNEYLKKKELI